MKKYKIIIFMSILFNLFACKAEKEVKPISKLSCGQHACYMYSGYDISFERISDDAAVLKVRRDGQQEPDSTYIGKNEIQELEQIVFEHKIEKYKRTYTPKFEVLDGESWSISISFADEDKSYLHSSGENAWPNDNGLTIIREWAYNLVPDGRDN